MTKLKLTLLLLLVFVQQVKAQKARYKMTFKNYRVAIGGGLGYSPLMLNNPLPFNYKPWNGGKPSLKLELVTGPKFSLNFGLQIEQYKFNISPNVLFTNVFNGNQFYGKINTGARAQILTYTLDFRRYSTYYGYIAPLGRYLMYGVSMNTMTTTVNSYSYTTNDSYNGNTTYSKPKTSEKLLPVYGIRFGYGKKRYIGENLKTFLEYQLLFDLKMGEFGKGLYPEQLPKNGETSKVTYETGMRISQRNSIFQLNLMYGFSF